MPSHPACPSLNPSILEWIRHFPKDAPREEEFDRLALGLFARQWEQVTPYRRWIQSRQKKEATPGHWTEIPAIPLAAFKEQNLRAFPDEETIATFHSSGTTGATPSRHHHHAASLDVYEVSLWRGFQHAVLAPSLQSAHLLCLSPSPRQSPHSSLVHMFETVKQRHPWIRAEYVAMADPAGLWHLDLKRLSDALHRSCHDGVPALLLGTAFMFVHALEYFARAGLTFSLPPGSGLMETGGYKGRSHAWPKELLHDRLSKFLGLPREQILCEYGMCELSSQAYDAAGGLAPSANRRFQFPPWARIQVVSPETERPVPDGETGLLRVLDLANVGSVCALQTEDLVIAHGQSFELRGRSANAEPRGCSLSAP